MTTTNTKGAEWEKEVEQLFQYYDDIDIAVTVDQRITAKEQAELWLKRTITHQRQQAVAEFAREVIARKYMSDDLGGGYAVNEDDIHTLLEKHNISI